MGTLNATMNIMVGVAGSGKSTTVKTIVSSWRHKRFVVICPDEIREQMCNGNRSDQSKNFEVWQEAYRQVDEAIANNKDIIFDATMLNPNKRKVLIDKAYTAKMTVIAHVVKRELDTILTQNANRKWKVPERIVKNMFKSYIAPSHEEGFHRVIYYTEQGILK